VNVKIIFYFKLRNLSVTFSYRMPSFIGILNRFVSIVDISFNNLLGFFCVFIDLFFTGFFMPMIFISLFSLLRLFKFLVFLAVFLCFKIFMKVF